MSDSEKEVWEDGPNVKEIVSFVLCLLFLAAASFTGGYIWKSGHADADMMSLVRKQSALIAKQDTLITKISEQRDDAMDCVNELFERENRTQAYNDSITQIVVDHFCKRETRIGNLLLIPTCARKKMRWNYYTDVTYTGTFSDTSMVHVEKGDPVKWDKWQRRKVNK